MSESLVQKKAKAANVAARVRAVAFAFHSTIQDVRLNTMKVSRLAQRELRPHRVDELHASFDPEMFGLPVLSLRGQHYYIVDGQHRIEAAKLWIGKDWESQSVTCRVYTGMNEQDEAAMYLRLNNQLPINAFDKFNVAVTAKRPIETAVQAVVDHCGLHVTKDKTIEGHISAVSTLCKIVARSDVKTLERSLRLVYQSFGTVGLSAPVIDGTAQVCERYNGAIHDKDTVEMLKELRGGVGALLTRAGAYRRQTGNQMAYCFGAALVDAINYKKIGKKLPSWWKAEE